MNARLCAIVASAVLAGAGGAAAREPGTVFYRCDVPHRFTLPGANGGPVIFNRGRPGRITSVRSAETTEHINASLEVEESGATSGLSLAWIQSGTFAFPEGGWRADLHPVYMQASAGRARIGNPDDAIRFDPATMEIEVIVVTDRRLRRPTDIRLSRPGERPGLMGLGAAADVPYYNNRRRAGARVLWRDLAAFAAGGTRLNVTLSEARGNALAIRPTLAQGTLDLGIMDRLIEHMRAAEAEVRALVPEAPARCERNIEPEPGPDI